MERKAGDDTSIGHLFAQLSDDARQFVRAEIKLYRIQVQVWTSGLKVVAILAVIALLLSQAALTALLVGLVLVIGQHLHSLGWATVIVVGGAFVVIAIMAGVAFARIKHLTRSPDSPR